MRFRELHNLNDEMITTDLYYLGIIDICDSLVTDLIKFLKEEGRYKYRMIGYIKKISSFFESYYENQTDEDIKTFGRILYFMHKSIYHDYKRLRNRKVSPADSVICILIKLMSFVPECQEIKDLLQMFHDNIKNKAKSDKLLRIDNTLKEAIKDLSLGKLKMSDINLYSLEHPEPKSQEIMGESKEWGGTNGKEIEL